MYRFRDCEKDNVYVDNSYCIQAKNQQDRKTYDTFSDVLKTKNPYISWKSSHDTPLKSQSFHVSSSYTEALKEMYLKENESVVKSSQLRIMTYNLHFRPYDSAIAQGNCDAVCIDNSFQNAQQRRARLFVKNIEKMKKQGEHPHILSLQELTQEDAAKIVLNGLRKLGYRGESVEFSNYCMKGRMNDSNSVLQDMQLLSKNIFVATGQTILVHDSCSYKEIRDDEPLRKSFDYYAGADQFNRKGVYGLKLQNKTNPNNVIYVFIMHPSPYVDSGLPTIIPDYQFRPHGEIEEYSPGFIHDIHTQQLMFARKNITKYVNSKNKPDIETIQGIFLCGDMNINMYQPMPGSEDEKTHEKASSCCSKEYQTMLDILSAEHPPIIPDTNETRWLNEQKLFDNRIDNGEKLITQKLPAGFGLFTWDAANNTIALDPLWDKQYQWIDYVLFMTDVEGVSNLKVPYMMDNRAISLGTRYVGENDFPEIGKQWQKECQQYRTKQIDILFEQTSVYVEQLEKTSFGKIATQLVVDVNKLNTIIAQLKNGCVNGCSNERTLKTTEEVLEVVNKHWIKLTQDFTVTYYDGFQLTNTQLWREKIQPFFSSSQKDYKGFIKYMKWLCQGNGKRLKRLLDDKVNSNLLFLLHYDLLEFVNYLSDVYTFIIAKMMRVQKIQNQNDSVTNNILRNQKLGIKLPNSIDNIIKKYEYDKKDFEFQDQSLLNGFRYTGTIVENDGQSKIQNPYRMIGDVSDHYGVLSYIYLNESHDTLNEVKVMYNAILEHNYILDNAYRNIIDSSTNIPALELFHRMNGSVFLQNSNDEAKVFLKKWIAVFRVKLEKQVFLKNIRQKKQDDSSLSSSDALYLSKIQNIIVNLNKTIKKLESHTDNNVYKCVSTKISCSNDKDQLCCLLNKLDSNLKQIEMFNMQHPICEPIQDSKLLVKYKNQFDGSQFEDYDDIQQNHKGLTMAKWCRLTRFNTLHDVKKNIFQILLDTEEFNALFFNPKQKHTFSQPNFDLPKIINNWLFKHLFQKIEFWRSDHANIQCFFIRTRETIDTPNDENIKALFPNKYDLVNLWRENISSTVNLLKRSIEKHIKSYTQNSIYVVFRMTDSDSSFINWNYNLDLRKLEELPGCMMHAGYSTLLYHTKYYFKKALTEFITNTSSNTNQKIKKMIFSGMSLGGALANLFGFCTRIWGLSTKDNLWIYTYGCPRIVSPSFAETINQMTRRNQLLQFVKLGDPVVTGKIFHLDTNALFNIPGHLIQDTSDNLIHDIKEGETMKLLIDEICPHQYQSFVKNALKTIDNDINIGQHCNYMGIYFDDGLVGCKGMYLLANNDNDMFQNFLKWLAGLETRPSYSDILKYIIRAYMNIVKMSTKVVGGIAAILSAAYNLTFTGLSLVIIIGLIIYYHLKTSDGQIRAHRLKYEISDSLNQIKLLAIELMNTTRINLMHKFTGRTKNILDSMTQILKFTKDSGPITIM